VGRALTSPRGVNLKADLPEPNLLTTAHASILRPALIRAIERLVQHMTSGEIMIAAEMAGEWIKITLTGSPTNAEAAPYSDFIHEAVTAQGGQVAVSRAGSQITFELTLPLARPVNVLVVDDNEDLAHFYRRYVAGTRYTLTHLADGRHLFETIAAAPPDIIVLDVMLPGVDGWELLTQLHAHPASRSIPVIVCSVVRGRDMAAALGAALYLQKPVRSRQFIEALERVLLPAPAAA
jgi:CheY-like chemotaxis protein